VSGDLPVARFRPDPDWDRLMVDVAAARRRTPAGDDIAQPVEQVEI
jgi:hypothetical protein